MPMESMGEAKTPAPSFRRKPESRFVAHELSPGLRRDDEVCTKSCVGITLSGHRGVRAIALRRYAARLARYPTHFRALRNMRIHGESSPRLSGCQDICTVRNTRSGCGIMIVKRPSAVVTPVMPAGEPFGL